MQGRTFGFIATTLGLTEGLGVFFEGVHFVDGKGTVLGLMVLHVPGEAKVMNIARLNEAIKDSDMVSV